MLAQRACTTNVVTVSGSGPGAQAGRTGSRDAGRRAHGEELNVAKARKTARRAGAGAKKASPKRKTVKKSARKAAKKAAPARRKAATRKGGLEEVCIEEDGRRSRLDERQRSRRRARRRRERRLARPRVAARLAPRHPHGADGHAPRGHRHRHVGAGPGRVAASRRRRRGLALSAGEPRHRGLSRSSSSLSRVLHAFHHPARPGGGVRRGLLHRRCRADPHVSGPGRMADRTAEVLHAARAVRPAARSRRRRRRRRGHLLLRPGTGRHGGREPAALGGPDDTGRRPPRRREGRKDDHVHGQRPPGDRARHFRHARHRHDDGERDAEAGLPHEGGGRRNTGRAVFHQADRAGEDRREVGREFHGIPEERHYK